MPDRGSRKALEWIQGMPFHPVREELELQARIAEHPLPWRAPNPRILHLSADASVPTCRLSTPCAPEGKPLDEGRSGSHDPRAAS
jgi:hypothetical protein